MNSWKIARLSGAVVVVAGQRLIIAATNDGVRTLRAWPTVHTTDGMFGFGGSRQHDYAHSAGGRMMVVVSYEVEARAQCARAVRAEEALRALGRVYQGAEKFPGAGWHYFGCPTRHGYADCDKKCRDAQVALKGLPE